MNEEENMGKHTKIISLLLSLIMVLSVFSIVPFSAVAEEIDASATGKIVDSGTTGDCTWTLDDAGVLTISGNGKMGSYDSYSYKAPWRDCFVYEVVVEKGVTTIGKFSFYDCRYLMTVSISDTVTGIGNYALYNCLSLTNITIPDSVTKIGDSAFYNCTDLKSATIGNSVTSIGSSAFYNCLSLTNITIPDSVTKIGDSAFYNCTDLKSATIGNSVTGIGESAFYNCTGLTSVTIPDSVTSIGEFSFWRCMGLTSVTIGDSVKSIGTSAFYGCSNLTSVHISDIGAWCSIGFSSNPLNYAHNLYLNDTLITDLVIPDSVTRICDGAFADCTSFTSIYIPDSVTSIGITSFYGCTGLTSVTIPDSVTSIGSHAFYNCENLKNVTINTPYMFTEHSHEVGQVIDYKAFGYYYDIDFESEYKVDEFTMYGFKGSATENYANDNGFTFIALTPEPKVGDADGDGQITVMDVTEVQHLLSSMNTKSDEATLMFADVDKNGVLEVIDATFILRYLADIEIPYVIG